MLPTLRFSQWWREEKGVSSIEYALLASLIGVTCVAAATAVGSNTMQLFLVVCNTVAAATGNPPC